MHFVFDEDQEMLRASTRQLLERDSPLDRTRALLDDPAGFDPALWTRGADLGWYGLLLPEEYGGGSLSGQGLVDLLVIAEEMGRLIVPLPWQSTTLAALAVADLGTPAQRAALLPGVAAGESRLAWAFTEPDGTAELDSVRLVARRGADGYLLSGTKRFVEGAGSAEHLVVAARLTGEAGDEADSEAGGELAQLVVPADAAGVTITPLAGIDLARRLFEVRFDDVQVGADALLGSGEPAAAALTRQLLVAAVLQSAESVGAAARIFELTVEYAGQRVQFGRTIASFQAIKHRLADLKVELEVARASAHYAGLVLGDGEPDAAAAVHLAAATVGEAFSHIAGEALQIHGGIGFTWEHDLHFYLRRATSNEVLLGTPDFHRDQLWSHLTAIPEATTWT